MQPAVEYSTAVLQECAVKQQPGSSATHKLGTNWKHTMGGGVFQKRMMSRTHRKININ